MLISDIKDPRLRARILRTLNDADQLKQDIVKECPTPKKKRIRQDPKPLMNKLEHEFFLRLCPPFDHNGYRLVIQSVRFRLANGLWYKPDFLKVGDDTDAPMVGYEVKGGRLGRMLRNPTYTGISPQFWGSLDRVGGEAEWKFWGTPNCGKGQPMQIGHTGHPSVPCRFRDVRVGVRG